VRREAGEAPPQRLHFRRAVESKEPAKKTGHVLVRTPKRKKPLIPVA
jgi:hypothetical protein